MGCLEQAAVDADRNQPRRRRSVRERPEEGEEQFARLGRSGDGAELRLARLHPPGRHLRGVRELGDLDERSADPFRLTSDWRGSAGWRGACRASSDCTHGSAT